MKIGKSPAGFVAVVSAAVLTVVFAACTSSIGPKQTEPADFSAQIAAARASLQIFPPAVREEKEPLVLVHYMPWFQAPPVSDGYGFHWHQGGGVFDPFETDQDGKAKIASHYYPLTGPYDTRDTSVLEYQAALMKMSGVDGVIFDWYGIEDALDYKEIQESTLAMIAVIKKAGLKFAVCYEDQSIGKMIEAAALAKADAQAAGKKVFSWMQQNWFSDDAYVTYEGRPLVLCFGPQFYKDKAQWDDLFSVMEVRPYFIGLDNHSEGWTDGSYDWPPMWASSSGKLSFARLVKYLNEFYAKQNAKPYLVATAFPGFHDIYREAGNGFSYGYLEYADGETFKLTMDAALQANPDVIQIGTWNDYGEGTIIEPTIERGYRELECIQDVKRRFNPAFGWGYGDLRMPIELYRILAADSDPDGRKPYARAAVDALFAGDAAAYKEALRAGNIKASLDVKPVLRSVTQGAGGASGSGTPVFDTAGRKNLALGAPVVVSSRIYDFTGNKAVDGDLLTYWEGAAKQYPATVTVDLIASRQLSAAVLKLNPKRIWNKRTQTFAVETSDDGTAFTELLPAAEYVFDPAVNENTAVVTLNVKARYVRFVFTANTAANAGQIAELEIYGE